MPRVTACVSVLNQPELLKQTLLSIKNQTFTDWECLVVDDGSTVPIKPVVDGMEDPRFIFHRFDENRGIPHGANWCYKHAKGEFIQTLGCDEFIWEKKFEIQVRYLDNFKDVDCVWGVPGNGPMGFVPSWEQYVTRAHNRSREHWIKTFINLEGVPIGGASALWRTKVFESIGYFDPQLTAFSDHEWFVRFFEKHNGVILPFRFMNEVPGHKTICTRTEKNAAKLDHEYAYVKSKHPLVIPNSSGLITIAMPVYNTAHFIKDALAAVAAQTDQNFELHIHDDGSTDNLQDVLTSIDFTFKPNVRFTRSEKNEGMFASVNRMLSEAKGDFFAIVSADDIMDSRFLEKCRAEFVKDPFLEYVASQNDFIDENGKPHDGPHPLKMIPKARNLQQNEWAELFYQGNIYFGIGLYRTSAVREVGGWKPEHKYLADYEMYLRLIPRYNFRIIEEALTHTRIHKQSQSQLSVEESKNLKKRYYEAQRPYYQPRPKIIIATPFYELKGFSPYITSLAETTKHLTRMGIAWQFMDLNGDSYVHRARNSICMNFLDDPYATDLFFIDSDMAWNAEAFINMIFRPEPIIGGTYPVKNKWDLWTSKPEIHDAEKDPHFVGVPLPDGSNLIKAHQLAGGFLRIKRSVLEKFIEHYPTNRYGDSHPIPEMRMEQVEFFSCGVNRAPEVNLLRDIEAEVMKNGGHVDMNPFKERFAQLRGIREFVGEDYYFSNMCRNMGVDMFIYPNATITHFGINAWAGNFDQTLRRMDEEKRKGVPVAGG